VQHSRVLFDGNGYSEDWIVEAEKRGLPHLRSTVEALPALVSDKTLQLFAKHQVFSSTELHSRYEVYLEHYSKSINIEAQAMIDIAKRQILPVVVRYATELAQSINAIRTAHAEAEVSAQAALLQETSSLLKVLNERINTLLTATSKAKELHGDAYEQGMYYRDVVFKAMNELREVADQLEVLVDYELWPLPSYTQMLFML